MYFLPNLSLQPNGFTWHLYTQESQIYISSSFFSSSRLIHSMIYLKSPLECYIGISKLACLIWNSWLTTLPPEKKKSISPTVFHISANGTTIQPAVKAKSKNHPDTSLILISYLIHHQALSNIPKKYITFISLQLYCYHPVQATIISQHYYCITSTSCICGT